jgi:hypothetical protein
MFILAAKPEGVLLLPRLTRPARSAGEAILEALIGINLAPGTWAILTGCVVTDPAPTGRSAAAGRRSTCRAVRNCIFDEHPQWKYAPHGATAESVHHRPVALPESVHLVAEAQKIQVDLPPPSLSSANVDLPCGV